MAFIVHCYDLLIKNGTVVDPVLGLNKKMDVGIYASRIADVFEPGSLPGKICGHKVIDASGMYVVPGLVDGHVHVLPGLRFTYPIDELWKRGITACIDMGSQTSASFHRERHLIDEAPCMVNACLGLSNMAETQGEIPRYVLLDQEVNLEKIQELFEVHGDVLVGIKVFIGHADSPGAELTHAVMKKARQVCDAVGCRMFVHVANPDVPLPELIDSSIPVTTSPIPIIKETSWIRTDTSTRRRGRPKGVVSSSIRPAAPATGAPRWPRLPLPRAFSPT